MLNVGLTPKSTGRSSLYALSLIHSSTLNGPSARGINLDFLKTGNLSFLGATKPIHQVQKSIAFYLYHQQGYT
jgi:hypothetical protein